MQNLKCNRIEVDEIWTFVGKKQKFLRTKEEKQQGFGDQYIFVALDADTKLVPCFYIGKRNMQSAVTFLNDLNYRVINRFQLSTDSFMAYTNAVEEVYGSDIDYGQVHKHYGHDFKGERRYSPPVVLSIRKKLLQGYPDKNYISTSYVERQNLSMRMNMRRFTRLTNAFSKKLENLKASVSLYYFHYNFMRVHQTLGTTPAIASNITNYVWSWEDFLGIKKLKQKVA